MLRCARPRKYPGPAPARLGSVNQLVPDSPYLQPTHSFLPCISKERVDVTEVEGVAGHPDDADEVTDQMRHLEFGKASTDTDNKVHRAQQARHADHRNDDSITEEERERGDEVQPNLV